MARSRNIKPGFYKNEELAQCSIPARLLFPGLWMLADREGRLENRPLRIKAEVFPFDNLDVAKLLDELQSKRLVVQYTADGGKYLWIPGFHRNQNPHPHEAVSKIPAPPLDAVTCNGMSETSPADSLFSESLLPASPTCVGAQPAEQFSAAVLLDWIAWWNRLHAESLVNAGTSATKASKSVLKGWARVQADASLRRMLEDREAIEREIRASPFCREGWFCLEKIFGGKNRDGEYIVRKVLDGAYRDKPKSAAKPSPGKSYDDRSRGNF